MPFDKNKYPDNWQEIRKAILSRANHCCEGTPEHTNCRAENYEPHPETGSKVVLTIAHMDHNTFNNHPSNLRALCQRCHLHHDRFQHAANAAKTREKNGRRKRSKSKKSKA